MKIVVTGASGRLGSLLTGYLLKYRRDVEVNAIVRDPRWSWDRSGQENLNIVHITAGAVGRLTLKEVLSNSDVIIHCAGLASTDDARSACEINVSYSKCVAKLAVESNVPVFIALSSAKVYGESSGNVPYSESAIPSPETIYARSKYLSEKAILKIAKGSATQIIILRPAKVIRVHEEAAIRVVKSLILRKGFWTVFLEGLVGRRSFLSERDFCNFLLALIANPVNAQLLYNLASSDLVLTYPDISTYRLNWRHRLAASLNTATSHALGAFLPDLRSKIRNNFEVETRRINATISNEKLVD